MIISLAGCRNNPDNFSSSQENSLSSSTSANHKSISLLYSYSDSFNPYTAKTTANRELSSLLYDSLIKTDNNFEPMYFLATSVQIESNQCIVRLRDAAFTDGSKLTTDDVIYSYNMAKNCARFADNFYAVTSVSPLDSKTIQFTLSQNDPYFINLLDFPIIKSNSSGLTNADGKEIMPIGCGRYYINDDGSCFEQNPNYYGKKGDIKTINLINSPDASSTTHYVEIGATYLYYTEGDNIVRMSGKKHNVNLNRFIYIGVNDSYGSLSSKEMRYAISSALNRTEICQTAYFNNAIAATGFFNPSFNETKALQTIENTPNSKITVENLSKIGYNNMNSNGFYSNSAGNNPVFTLLVNSENSSRVAAAKLIAEQCKTAGIQINVIECTYEQYVKRLESGSFQLYLGEIQLLNNMDFTQLVTPGGRAAYGVGNGALQQPDEDNSNNSSPNNTCSQILDTYKSGKCGISDVAGTLLTEMPQIPVCYLNGILFYNSDVKSGVQASVSDIYLNIENYEF